MILFRQMLSSSPYIFLLYVFEGHEVQECRRRRRSETMQILKDMSFPDMINNHLTWWREQLDDFIRDNLILIGFIFSKLTRSTHSFQDVFILIWYDRQNLRLKTSIIM